MEYLDFLKLNHYILSITHYIMKNIVYYSNHYRILVRAILKNDPMQIGKLCHYPHDRNNIEACVYTFICGNKLYYEEMSNIGYLWGAPDNYGYYCDNKIFGFVRVSEGNSLYSSIWIKNH